MFSTHQKQPSGIVTIRLSSRILVQGTFVRKIDKSRIIVRVGNKDFVGPPISQLA